MRQVERWTIESRSTFGRYVSVCLSVGVFAAVCLNSLPRVVFVFRLHCLLGTGRVHSKGAATPLAVLP